MANFFYYMDSVRTLPGYHMTRVFIFLEGDLGGNFFDRKEALHAESRRREARGSYFSIALITIEKTSLCPF